MRRVTIPSLEITRNTDTRLAYRSSGILNVRLFDLAILALVAITVVAPMFDNAGFQVFSYADELVTIIVVVSGMLFSSAALGVKERTGVLCLFSVGIFGVLGNILYGYQDSVFAVAVDGFTCLKMFATYFAAKRLFSNHSELVRLLSMLGKCFVSFATIGLIVHVSGLLTLGGDREWMGVASYQFLYGHPTEFAAYVTGFSAVLLIGRNNSPWVFLCTVLLAATQRSKAIAMAAVIFAIMLYNQRKQAKSRPPLVFIFLGAFTVVMLGFSQFEFYFGDSTSARTLLVRYGFVIAGSLFPFGSGFATFGTYMSGVYYSPLYYMYGLADVYGLMPGQTSYVSDCFWPAAAAQFGMIGLLMLIGAIVLMFLSFNSSSKARGITFAARVCMPIYLLIASTSESAFFNFYGVFFALLMASMASGQEEALSATTE